MRKRLQAASIALVCLAASAAAADPEGSCWTAGLRRLHAAAPDGYAIYKQASDPGFFKSMIRCDDAQYDLSTAVHETTHIVTGEQDAFPLVGGGAIKLPHEASRFYPPMKIAKRFKPDDFTTVYLRLGQASSATDFLYLLDELNAYTHDLNAAVDLKDLSSTDEAVDHRDGLAALMAFVAVYAETAEASEPETWRGLQDPKVAGVVARLWAQAERVMASSCGIPNFGTEDKAYIRRYCAAPARAALQPILGRDPVCPAACLQPTAQIEPASDMATGDTATGDTATGDTPTGDLETGDTARRSSTIPSWLQTIIRSKTLDGAAQPDGSADEAR